VIAIILDDDHAMHMRIAAEEVKARGARVFVITDNPKLALGIDNDPLIIPSNGPLTALIAVLPLQVRTTPVHLCSVFSVECVDIRGTKSLMLLGCVLSSTLCLLPLISFSPLSLSFRLSLPPFLRLSFPLSLFLPPSAAHRLRARSLEGNQPRRAQEFGEGSHHGLGGIRDRVGVRGSDR
jgi:hypothetical protein